MDKFREIGRGKAVEGFECENQGLKSDSKMHREPMEGSEDWSNVVEFSGSGQQTGGSILHQLKACYFLLAGSEVQGVTVIQPGCNVGMDYSLKMLRGEEGFYFWPIASDGKSRTWLLS